jgi:hypothetical protein
MPLRIETPDRLVGEPGRFPGRIGLHLVKEGSVAGIFGIDVDLARKNGLADLLGRSELEAGFHRNAVALEQEGDHAAEKGALGVGLRGNDHPIVTMGNGRRAGQGQNGPQGEKLHTGSG